MKRFSITIASILFFLVSVGSVHGASFEISGGTENNVTTDTAQTITGKKTFSDNTKQCFGDDDDSCLYWDASKHLFEQVPGDAIWTYQTSSDSGTQNRLRVVSPNSTWTIELRAHDTKGSSLASLGSNLGIFVPNGDTIRFLDASENIGLVVDPTNELIAGSVASGGNLALSGSTHNTKGDVVIHSTSYLRFDKTSSGAPSAGDCDDDGDRGRLVIDTTNDRLYLCNGGARAWDVITLTDSADLKPTAIGFIIDGGGAVITVGEKGHVEIPYACTISRVTMLADQSGDIEVDIWKDTFGNFPPTSGDSITSSTVATISGDVAHQDTTLTSWTTSVTAGDILAYNVDTVKTIQRVMVSLKCDRD